MNHEPRTMNYNKAEQFVLSLVNIPRKEYMKEAKNCVIYLKRLQFFLGLIGNPEKKIPHYIHVTGTSGKGSVCSLIHSILHTSGKKTGVLQSPHPTQITERWKVANKTMSKKEFVDLVEYIKPKLDEYLRKSPYDMISYPELIFAIGLLYFAKKEIEYAVIEVGCGGRYDATNVIPHKDIAVITNIGIDHAYLIGPTKSDIAYEKAGIIKPKCKVFTNENNKKILEIIKTECNKQKVKLYNIKNKSNYRIKNTNFLETQFKYTREKYKINTPGKHQIENAILAIEIAKSLNIPLHDIKKGIRKVSQPLRFEIVSKEPLIILDGAHNTDKIKTTVKTLLELNKNNKKNISLVIGFSCDKEWKKMLKIIAKLKPKYIAVTRNSTNHFRKVENPKTIDDEIKKILPESKTEVFLDSREAFKWSRKNTKNNDIILITGSIFLSGELRPIFTPTPN
jgi:dihydrofolate synthase/folylpolyglutamate synthase